MTAFAWVGKTDVGQQCPGWGIVDDDRTPRPQYEALVEAYAADPERCEP